MGKGGGGKGGGDAERKKNEARKKFLQDKKRGLIDREPQKVCDHAEREKKVFDRSMIKALDFFGKSAPSAPASAAANNTNSGSTATSTAKTSTAGPFSWQQTSAAKKDDGQKPPDYWNRSVGSSSRDWEGSNHDHKPDNLSHTHAGNASSWGLSRAGANDNDGASSSCRKPSGNRNAGEDDPWTDWKECAEQQSKSTEAGGDSKETVWTWQHAKKTVEERRAAEERAIAKKRVEEAMMAARSSNQGASSSSSAVLNNNYRGGATNNAASSPVLSFFSNRHSATSRLPIANPYPPASDMDDISPLNVAASEHGYTQMAEAGSPSSLEVMRKTRRSRVRSRSSSPSIVDVEEHNIEVERDDLPLVAATSSRTSGSPVYPQLPILENEYPDLPLDESVNVLTQANLSDYLLGPAGDASDPQRPVSKAELESARDQFEERLLQKEVELEEHKAMFDEYREKMEARVRKLETALQGLLEGSGSSAGAARKSGLSVPEQPPDCHFAN